MTEWIDFLVYAVQNVLFWFVMPRQGRRFTVPMIADRNAAWVAANPDTVMRLERSTWFVNAYTLWAIASVAVLLMATLDLAPFGGRAPKWELLKDLHATFMIGGMLGWFAAMLLWSRWLTKYVPLAETRHATLRPRAASDYLPLSWRVVVETLTVLHLGLWLAIPALGYPTGAKYWQGFAFIVAVTILVAVVAALVPRRRPGYPERIFGENYRRVELKVAYILRLLPLNAGAMMIGELVFGLEVDRIGNLVLVAAISAVFLVLLRLRPVGGAQGAVESRLTAPARR